MFGSGDVLDSKFLIVLVMHELIPTHELEQGAQNVICKFVAWSLTRLMAGRLRHATAVATVTWTRNSVGRRTISAMLE